MPKYVVYEIWTKARIIEAKNDTEAYRKGEPLEVTDDLSLSNWHVKNIEDKF